MAHNEYPYDFDWGGRPQHYGAGNEPYQENWGEWANPRNWTQGQNTRYGEQYDWRTAEDWWNVPGPYTGQGPKGYTRSDDDIDRAVSERLAANGQLDASDIEVHVNDGEVTLDGSVDSRSSKRLAEDIADSVWGVKDVHNHLRVRGRSSPGQGWRHVE